MFAADDYVVVEREVRSTAKRKPLAMHFVDVFAIRDGKIARISEWSNPAELSTPATPPTPAK